MLKKILFQSLLVFLSFSLFAQKDKVKFGDINPSDFQDTYQDLATDPHAVILYDKGDVSFEYKTGRGFEIQTVFHMRVHILNKSQLDMGNISLKYFSQKNENTDILYNIKAVTHNLQAGKVVSSELDKKSIYQEKLSDDYSSKTFSLPNVKVGSIIEYTYTKKSTLNHSSKPGDWYFQGEHPVRWSEINVEIPNYFYYQIIMGGYLPLTINENGSSTVTVPGLDTRTNTTTYRFAVANAPAFKDEPFITTSKDYISKIEFELSSVSFPDQPTKNYNTTWPELDATLLKSDSWDSFLNGRADFDKMAADFKNIPDKRQRAEAIYNYMIDKFSWNEYIGVFTTDRLKKTLDDKSGSVTSLNLITYRLMKEAGLEVHPVIISTRNNGKINNVYPLLDRFNYTILNLYLDTENMFIDVTDPLLPMGVLPTRALSNEGREISNGIGHFVPITSTRGYSELEEIQVVFDLENGQINGTVKNMSDGYPAKELRQAIKKMGEEDFKKSFHSKYTEWKISDVAVENSENPSKPISTSFNFIKDDVGVMVDMIYLNPLLVGKVNESPFKAKKRDFPVDFAHKTNQTVMAKFEIPEGFQVEEMPKPINLILPENGAKFLFHTSVLGNSITVVSRISMQKTLFYADQYPNLKEFYDIIVDKHAEQIVLSKIEK